MANNDQCGNREKLKRKQRETEARCAHILTVSGKKRG